MEQREFSYLIRELLREMRTTPLKDRSNLIIEFISRFGWVEDLEDIVCDHWRDVQELSD